MALPVANLGYMPNMSTPSGGGHYQVDNPWQQLAIQALAQVVSKGVGNAMSPEFTSQAQHEGLPVDPAATDAPWWKKALTGPTTSREDIERLRTNQNTQNIAVQGEKGATKRSEEQIAATKSEGAATRGLQRDLEIKRSVDETNRLMAQLANQSSIAAGSNLTSLQGIDKQLAGAQTREEMGNKTAIDVAGIHETDRAQLLKVIQDLIGRNATMRASGMNMPPDDQMIQELIKHAAALGYKVPQSQPLPGLMPQ